MLVPYQLPQSGILIIRQMVCKKRGGKEERVETNKKNFSNFPFLLQLKDCHNDFFK